MGAEFEIGKIPFELEDLKRKRKKEEGKKGNRRIFLFRNRFRPLGAIYIYVRKEILKRGIFSENFSGRRTERAEKNDRSQDHPGMFCDYLPMLYLIPFWRIL